MTDDRDTPSAGVGKIVRCPFCGCPSAETKMVQIAGEGWRAHMECDQCGAMGPARVTEQGRLEAWAKRYEAHAAPKHERVREAAQAVVRAYPVAAGTVKTLDGEGDGYGPIRALRLALSDHSPDAGNMVATPPAPGEDVVPTPEMLAAGRDAIEPYVQNGLSKAVANQWQIAREVWIAMSIALAAAPSPAVGEV